MRTPAPDLEILFDTAVSPIGGELIDREGQVHSFAGWMQLLALIEESHAARVAAVETFAADRRGDALH